MLQLLLTIHIVKSIFYCNFFNFSNLFPNGNPDQIYIQLFLPEQSASDRVSIFYCTLYIIASEKRGKNGLERKKKQGSVVKIGNGFGSKRHLGEIS